MKTQDMPSLLLGRDIELSRLHNQFCLVEQFTESPGTSIAKPYGLLVVQSQVLDQPFTIPILHKLDVTNIKEAFRVRSTNPETEIVVVLPKQRTSMIGKIFRAFLPVIHTYVFPRGTYAKITNRQWWDNAKGEASILEIKPLEEWPLRFE